VRVKKENKFILKNDYKYSKISHRHCYYLLSKFHKKKLFGEESNNTFIVLRLKRHKLSQN